VAVAAVAAGLVAAVYAWRSDRDARIASNRVAEPRVAVGPAEVPMVAESARPVVARPVAAPVERHSASRPLRVADARAARRARSAPRIERFEPLYPGDLLADLDAVHVVRVSVPRSSLAALGWPSRPGVRGRVELDAMVGPDGMTRAVRFISQ
jgi:hypothetical protein